jgi:MFS transporter, putative metabolite:H+ symporter
MATMRPDFLQAYDSSRLSRRFWAVMGILVLLPMFDFFDFFVVGYIVAVLSKVWHLTFGQSAMMLIGAGFGAIFGSLLMGALADRFGRKPYLILSNIIVAVGAGGIAVMPENSWFLFAVLRIFVGFGLGGSQAVHAAVSVEITPTRYRTVIASLLVAPASLGIILAASSASALLPVIGWRGLSAIGLLPAVFGLLLIPIMPESTRWLLTQGRFTDARRAAAKQLGVAEATLPMPAGVLTKPKPAALRELFLHKRAFWLIFFTWLGISTTTYGYQLWAPTILSSAIHEPVSKVAGYFTIVGFCGLIGRFIFSALPMRIGRRRAGQVMSVGAAIFIFCAGFYHRDFYGDIPAFILWLSLAAIFVNGGFSNMAPYAPESYPVRLAASASGFAQGVNGIGKMLGPLVLGLIAGIGNLVSSSATEAAVIPGFTLLAGCCAVAFLAYTLLPIETHGKAMIVDREPEPEVRAEVLTNTH